MKIYISHTSPFARIPRIVLREKRLVDRIEEVVPQMRVPDSPYYQVNPSGRIPFLRVDEGFTIEGSDLIAAYFDHLDGKPLFDMPTGVERWHALHMQEMARSLMDGLAVWVRELKRPSEEQSPTTLTHEETRSERLLAWWEARAHEPLLNGPLNMIQITLASALDLDRRIGPFNWRGDHPGLNQWINGLAARPSLRDTAALDGSMVG
ncbi:MAG: glutathione S-transferase N-terminal domain-containing protein [Pseudomonadota bacterium]